MDGFKTIVNGVIKLLNKVPLVDIPLLGTSGGSAGMETGPSTKAEIEPSTGIGDKLGSFFDKLTGGNDNEENAKTLMSEGDVSNSKNSNNVGVSQDNRQIVTTNNQESVFAGRGNPNPDPPSMWEKMTSLF